MTGWDLADQMHAVIAVDDGQRLTNGTVITVDPTFDPGEMVGQTGVPATGAGIVGTLYTGGDVQTFVVAGSPTVLVQSADPVAFVDAAGGVPVVDIQVGPDGSATFALGELPDGYGVVVEPTVPMPGGSVHAWTRLPSDDGDDVLVEVGAEAYGMRWVVYSDFVRVDIAGRPGWLVGRAGATIMWQVGERSWAFVNGPTSEVALEAARSFEFVDRATFEQRYGAQLGPQLTREEWESGATATTVPAADASRLVCSVIGRSPSNFDDRIEIDCGSDHGVVVGMPVVLPAPSPGGSIVGKVSEISDATSVVMLITHPQYTVQAIVSGIRGIVSGNGTDRPLVLGTADPAGADGVQAGALVETVGGDDSLAPSGLAVGRVVGRDGVTGAWQVEPDVDVSDIDAVAVVLFAPVRDRSA